MNKKNKMFVLIFSCTFLCGLAVNCSNTTSQLSKENTDKEPIPPESGEKVDTTIEDAYEDTRPNYEEDFDFIPDYEPEGIVDPNATFELTISDNSSITFKDGTKVKGFKPGTSLTLEDLDLSKIEKGRTLKGFAEVNNKGEYINAKNLGQFVTPKRAMTIMPYFSQPEGYTWLDIGSGSYTKFNFDKVPGSVTENQTIKYEANKLIPGGKNGYLELGAAFNEPSKITKASAIRLDTSTNIISTAGVYEFNYNFANFGKEDIHLNLYQISSSSEYKTGFTYEERYCVKIDLKPGESTSINPRPQYKLNENKNALTYIVAREEMNSMYLGMSMSIKATDLKEPTTVNPPKPVLKAKIDLNLPEGIQVKDTYAKEGIVGKAIVLPKDDEIINTTGRTIEGWYANEIKPQIIGPTTALQEEGVTISPYFAPVKGKTVVALSGKNGLPDYFGKLAKIEDEKDEGLDTKLFSSQTNFLNNERGVLLNHSGILEGDEYFRMLSVANDKIVANGEYELTFTLHNYKNEAIKLEIIQVQGGKKIKPEEGAVSTSTFEIKPQETVTKTIRIKLEKANSNLMTVVLPKSKITNLSLGVNITQERIVNIEAKHELKLDTEANITFKDGTKSVQLAEGSALPEIINNTGRNLLGFAFDSTLISKDNFQMPNKAASLIPYFATKEGYTRLWAMDGKNGFIPNNHSNDVDVTKFEGQDPQKTKTIVKGKDGLNEEGVTFKYNLPLKNGSYFRTDTKSRPSGITIGTHAYSLNYENKGTEKIVFDVFFVNSGVDEASCKNNKFTLTLEPGQATTIEISPTYAKNNGNILTKYVCRNEIKALNLGVSMSIKHGTK